MSPNTRRTILKVASGLGAAAAVAGVGAAQEADDADIELGGRTSGWEGVSPEEIAGETNPTLELVAGEEYVLVWENLDGQAHNFVIEDGDGEALVASDYATRGTQTVEFTANEEMNEYYCEPHPSQMRGDVEIVQEDDGDGDETETDDETEVEPFAVAAAEHFELTLDEDGWHGEQPEEIAGEQNPTLSVLLDQPYVISFRNEFGEADDGNGEGDGENGDGDDEGAEGAEDEDAQAEDEDAQAGEEDEDGDEDAEAGEEVAHEEGSTLQLVDENDEEIVSTGTLEPGNRGAIAFVATEEIDAYRDDSSGAEGAIEIGEERADGEDETADAGQEENATEDAGQDGNATEDAGQEENATEDAGQEENATDDAGQEENATDDAAEDG